MEGERRDFEGRCWGGVAGKWSALERIDTAIECSAAGDRLRRHSRQPFFCGPIWQNKDQRLREAHHSANTRLGRRGAFASTAGQQRPAHTFERSEQRRPRRVRPKKKKKDEGDASCGLDHSRKCLNQYGLFDTHGASYSTLRTRRTGTPSS